ncbi:MAG: hypothetical protein CL910_11300 [Deltaproteobacteria bacterium]|jgi:cytochrome c2|nr:hypothetical protein [Deltaproteobacteria bacterium]
MDRPLKSPLACALVLLVWVMGAHAEADASAELGGDRGSVSEAVPEPGAPAEAGATAEAEPKGDPEAGKIFFESIQGGNCKTCHYTNQLRMVGPGMENVTRRHTREWMRSWLTDPQGTWQSDHPETEDLKSRTRKGRVPVTACQKGKMTEGQLNDLISFLETLEKD